MEDRFTKDVNKITAFRYIVMTNYPDLFEDLKRKEELWFDLSITSYQNWLEKNIELNEEDLVSLTLYSIAFGKSIQEVKDFMNSKKI